VIAADGRDMALNDPRRQIGSVLQSSTLLPCSIKDNINIRTMTKEVWTALDAAAVA
jgi:ABC-type multidrug transport system fused ATPase/permease subunit